MEEFAEKLYWILIEEGQRNTKLHLGDIIKITPDEVKEIVLRHTELKDYIVR